MSTPRQKTYMPEHFAPSAWDVVCGRGKRHNGHPGNKRFRAIIAANMHRYVRADSKLDKTLVVLSVVESIREGPPAIGFVKLDAKTNTWYDIGDQLAREKVGHALRDAITAQNNGGRNKTRKQGKLKETTRKQQVAREADPRDENHDSNDRFERFLHDTFLEEDNDFFTETTSPEGQAKRDDDAAEATIEPLPLWTVPPVMHSVPNATDAPQIIQAPSHNPFPWREARHDP